MRIRSRLAVAAGFGILAAADSATAVVLTWDSDSTTTPAVVDGSGSWNTTAANTVWWDGTNNVPWTTLNDAVFGGTTGTPGIVTITTAVTPNSMTFNVPGYTVADTSTSARLILGGTGGVTANETAIVKSFRTALMQTATQTWTVAPGKSFSMDATPGTNTQQFITGANSDSGKTLTLGGGGTVNFIASSNTFGLSVAQNSTLIVNNVTMTSSGRTASATPDDLAIAFRGRTGAGLPSKTFVNTGGLIDVGTNVVTVQMNIDAPTQAPLGAPGELHLDGGTIATGGFGNATSVNPLGSQGALYFNGGEVKATKSNANFMVAPFVAGVGGAGLSAVYVGAAGANINTNGFDITVATPLIPDPSSAGGGFTKKGAGTLTMTAASTYTGGTTVQAGTLQVKRMHENNPVNITAGTLRVLESAPTLADGLPTGNNASVSRPSALTIAPGATLDLANNDMVLDYTNQADNPAVAIEALIAQGYNGGNWFGTGVTSSVAQQDGNFALAIADNGLLNTAYTSFSGLSVDNTSVLVKFTWVDDIDLDGQVTTNDAITFGNNYSLGDPATRATGDMDYDGVFTTNDAIIFGNNYDTSLPSLPEPGSLALLGVAGRMASRRIRRR